MTRTIGIGVIGMGWMGMTHSQSYRQIPVYFQDSDLQPRLVICADEVEARAKKAQTVHDFEQFTTDWREVVNHPDIEVVNIATPNSQHVEIAEAVAAAGKHIFCEKPVGRNAKETAAIERAAREAGVYSFVGFNYRWSPLVQYAREMIASGKLGTITHYRGRFFSMYGSNPHSVLSWRFERETAGLGTLGDLMSHVYDMAHMLVGPAQRVVANGETFIKERPLATAGEGTHFSTSAGGPTGAVTNEDYVGALVQFANGAHGSLEACRVIYGPKCEMAFEVNGTKGALSWNFERMNELRIYMPDSDGAHEGYTTIFSGPDHPLHLNFNPGPGIGMGYNDLKIIEAYQFLRSVADGKQQEPSFKAAVAVAEFQAAVEASWESNGWAAVKPIDG
jgi:predicted dehydrogenase